MLRKATGIAGAIAAGAILTTAALATGVSVSAYRAAALNAAPTQSQMINRDGKGDRRPAIQKAADTEVERMPVESRRPVLSPTSPGTGCEPLVAAHTAPEEVARVPGRCIT